MSTSQGGQREPREAVIQSWEGSGWVKKDRRSGWGGRQLSKWRKWKVQSQEVKEDTILCGTLEVMPIPKQGGLMILRVGYLLYKPAT